MKLFIRRRITCNDSMNILFQKTLIVFIYNFPSGIFILHNIF